MPCRIGAAAAPETDGPYPGRPWSSVARNQVAVAGGLHGHGLGGQFDRPLPRRVAAGAVVQDCRGTQDRVTGKVKLAFQIEDPGPPAAASCRGPEEDAFEMAELPGDREHLARGRGAVSQEDRDAVARERGIGENVDMLELHVSNVRT